MVWIMDNNQRGRPLEYQRFGSSHRLMKVTGRTCVQYKPYLVDICIENDRCHITYQSGNI